MAYAVEGSVTQGYVGAISYLHDRDILKKYFDRYNEGNIMTFFRDTAKVKETVNTDFRHFEKDWIRAGLKVAAGGVSGTAGAGNPVVITLDASVHQESGALTPGIVGETVKTSSGVDGIITAKSTSTPNAHTLTIKPLNNGNIVAAIVAGDSIMITGNAHGEGTGQPNGKVQKPLRFDFKTQIFKTAYTVTGSEASNKSEINFKGKPYYYLEGAADCLTNHDLDIEFAFLLNGAPSTFTDANGNAGSTSAGLQWMIDTYGYTEDYATTFDSLDYLRSIVKRQQMERVGSELLMLNGVDIDLQIDALMTDTMINGGIQYNTFGSGDGKKKAIDLNYNSFRIGNYSFHKTVLGGFSHPQVTALPGYSYTKTSFVIPQGKVRDAKTNEDMSTIMMRYKNENGKSRKYIEWTRDITVNNVDKLEFNHLSDVGLQGCGMNGFVKIVPA